MREFDELTEVVERLRAENGCPWDRAQTHESLKRECIEEAAEVIGGIDILAQTGKAENLKEELGDLLLQVVMHAQIAKEEGLFSIEDVVRGITEKMLRRHPHVFAAAAGDGKPDSPAVLRQWEEIKKAEKAGREWEKAYLPDAFRESAELLRESAERKGFSGPKMQAEWQST